MKNANSLILVAALTVACSHIPSAAWGSNDTSTAKLTEAHGDVFKRGFIDWEKEQWAEPEPAKKGDLMHEGMQLGTGEKSWAQLTWSYITARAWANSVYAIAPNQRLVYLMGGEMLYHLDKHRKEKSDYFVWTKLIQARIRGTTVLFQCTNDTTRVTVLEGCIDVMNRKDKSIVRIEPGVVYEVKETQKEAPHADGISNAITSTTANPSAAISAVNPVAPTAQNAHTGSIALEAMPDITLPKAAPVKVFQTQQTITSILPANPEALLVHPLLTSLESPLSSLPLVSAALSPLIGKVNALLDSTTGALNKTLLSTVKIIGVPTTVNYEVGPMVGSAFTLPQTSVAFFPPTGIIGKPGGPAQFTGPGPLVNHLTNLGNSNLLRTGSILPNVGALGAGVTGITGVTGAAGMSGFSGGGGGGIAGISSGLTSGFSGAQGAFGGGGFVGGAFGGGGFAARTGGAGGAGMVPSVAGVVQGVGGVVPGVVSGVTGSVNTLLQNTTSGLGRITGSLGLPLGR